MQAFVERHRPDELILTANVFDHAARARSFELAMAAWTAWKIVRSEAELRGNSRLGALLARLRAAEEGERLVFFVGRPRKGGVA